MRGMNASTGKPLDGIDHLRQSITDILMTPIGSRVMRRDYGSRLSELIDAPLNLVTKAWINYATIEALLKWEPRIIPRRVQITLASPGEIEIELQALYVPTGEVVNMDGITVTS